MMIQSVLQCLRIVLGVQLLSRLDNPLQIPLNLGNTDMFLEFTYYELLPSLEGIVLVYSLSSVCHLYFYYMPTLALALSVVSFWHQLSLLHQFKQFTDPGLF